MIEGQLIPLHDGQETVQTFVRIDGPITASETALLIPDPLATSFAFRNILPVLVAKGIRVVTFDFPGTGNSEGIEELIDCNYCLIIMNMSIYISIHLFIYRSNYSLMESKKTGSAWHG